MLPQVTRGCKTFSGGDPSSSVTGAALLINDGFLSSAGIIKTLFSANGIRHPQLRYFFSDGIICFPRVLVGPTQAALHVGATPETVTKNHKKV